MILKSNITYLLPVIWLMASLIAAGQQAEIPQGGSECASVEAQRLSFLIGEWKVKSRFRLSKEPEKWEETQARAKIGYLFENCLLEEQTEGTRQGHALKATAMYTYNRTSKKYEWVGADSEHGFLTLYSGSLNGNDLVLETMVKILSESILLRRVLTKKPAGGFEIRYQRSSDNGKNWDTAWYLVYSRL